MVNDLWSSSFMLRASHYKAVWPYFTGSMPEIAAGLRPCYERRPAMLALPKQHTACGKKSHAKPMDLDYQTALSARGKKSNTTPREFDHKTAPSACGKQKVTPNQGNLTTKQRSAGVARKAGPKQGNLKMSSLP